VKTIISGRGRKKKNKRKEDKAIQRKKSLGALRIIGVLLIFGGLFFASSLGLEALEEAVVFQVKEINWIGLKHYKVSEMQQRFQPLFGTNLFRVNIRGVQKELLSDPWIQTATVKKQFPDRLMILIEERKAAAVRYEGKLKDGIMQVDLSKEPVLLDAEARILQGGGSYPLDLTRLVNFKPAAYKKSLMLGKILREQAGESLSNPLIDLSNPENLRVYFSGLKKGLGGLIHFGKERYEARWKRFLSVEKDLQKRVFSYWEVDLRFPGKVVLKPFKSGQLKRKI